MGNRIKTLAKESKILIADDMLYWHQVAKNNFHHHEFNNLSHAYSLNEATNLYQKESPLIILTDINFDPRCPGDPVNNKGNLDGLILTREIKQDDPNKIIIVMSSIEEGARQAAQEAGANYFIQKQNFIKEFGEIAKQWK